MTSVPPSVPHLYSTWRHRKNKSIVYRVIGIANTEYFSSEHPVMVIYSGPNGNLWTIELKDWHKKMVSYVQEEW